MALPAAPTAEQHDKIGDALSTIPGAEFLRPHLIEGPYRIVGVEKAGEPNWQAEVILNAFPAVRVPRKSYWDPTTVEYLDLYVLPKLLADIVEWHGDEYKLEIDNDTRFEEWDTWPLEAQWVDVLGDLITHEDADHSDFHRYRNAVNELGVEQYCALAAELERQNPTTDTFYAVIRAALRG